MLKRRHPLVAAPTDTAGSKPGKRLDLPLAAAATCVVVMLTAPLVGANPTGGQVVRGNAAITTGPKQVTVDQRSGKAVINWNGFSIDPGEVTQFNQPGKRAIALNRVITNHPSHINGQLRANGSVWLINQNGITIGPDGKVQAQGFLATTADIADDNFISGRYQFDRPSANHDAKVVNQGHISIKERGLGALVAPHARNDGVITGQGSTVVIAGAKTFAVDLYGDGLINFETGSPVTHKPEGVESLAANHGIIEAEGGQVLITAAAAEGIVDQAIRVGGKIHARSAYTDGGEIVLDGGDHGTVAVTGTLDASSGSGRGGKIDIRGHRIRVERKSLVKASGGAGGGDIRIIGGDQSGQGPGPNADAVVLAAEARIIADATGFGDGGSIIVYGTETARIDGTLMARGGPTGGDGGFIETSAVGTIDIESAQVDASAPAGEPGTWLIDPQDITIDTAEADNIETALEGGTNVEVTTADGTPPYGSGSPGPGNITVEASIQPDLTKNPNSTQQTVTLTLTADNDVNIDSGVTIGPTKADAGDSMGVTITAGNDITNNGTIDVSAGGGVVNLTAARNIALGRIDAGTGDIGIIATAGAISDNTVGEGVGNENLVGGSINLIAGTGIGGSVVGTDIDIAATSLDATVTGSSGGIFIAETDDLALGRIEAAVNPITGIGFGAITIKAGSAKTPGSITDKTPGDDSQKNLVGDVISLTAVGGAIGGSGDADIDTQANSLDANAGGGIDIDNTLGSPVTVSSLTSGGSGNIRFDQSGGGAVAFGTVTTNDGAVTLTNANADLSVTGPIEAGGDGKDLTLTTTGSGDITLSGTTTATDDEVRITSAGTINGAGSVTANTADLDAAGGIGSTTTALALAAAKVSADTAGGGVDLDNTLTTATTVTSLTSGGIGGIRFDQSGGGAVAFGSVTTNDGAVTLTNANADLSVTGPIEAGGDGKDLTLTTTGSGDITLSGTTTATDDEVRITSAGAINGSGKLTATTADLDAAGGIGNTTALELAAAKISADTASGGVDLDNTLTTATTVTRLTSGGIGGIRFDQSGSGAVAFGTVTTNDGGVTLTNTNADLSVTGSIEAGGDGKDLTLTTTGSGDITLGGTTTATGDEVRITSAGAINGAGLVSAATVDLDAAGGIGNTTAPELAAASISADTASGGVDVDNTLGSEVTVSSLTSGGSGDIRFDQSGGGAVAFGTVTTDAGAVTLTNDTAGLSVTGPITAGGAGNAVALDAAGLLHIAAAVSGGSVEFTGGTGIAHTAAGDVTSTSGGITAGATTGDITMVEDSTTGDVTAYTSTGGDVTLTAADNVNLGRVDADGNTISVTATGGKISDITEAEGADNENLVGREIILRAGSGIGAVGEATDIDTRMADRIDAKITGPSGDVAIAETGAVRLGSTVLVIPGTGGSIQVSGSTMTIEQAVTTTGSGTIGLTTTTGDLQVDQAVTAGGGLSLDAAGLLSLAAAVGGSTVELKGGTGIEHTATGDVISGGTITATATSGDIGMADGTVYNAGGAVNLTAANDVNLGRVEAGANPIRVTAGTGAISDITGAENENLVGGAITLQAATGIGAPGSADIDTAVTSIDAQTTTGGIFIDETDAVTLGPVTTGSGGGTIDIISGGAMTIAQAVTTAGGGAISLTTTAGDLQVGQAVSAGGNLSLDAAGLLHIAAAISGSSVELTGGTSIMHTAAGNVTSGGAITATATSGDIGMADGTVYRAGGAVNLTAANDVNLGRVEAGANPINIKATAGSINDITGAEDENLVGGAITLQAATGIGAPGSAADIDTKAVSLDAQTTSGGIFIDETDAVQCGEPTDCDITDPGTPDKVTEPEKIPDETIGLQVLEFLETSDSGLRLTPDVFSSLADAYAIPDYEADDELYMVHLNGANESIWEQSGGYDDEEESAAEEE